MENKPIETPVIESAKIENTPVTKKSNIFHKLKNKKVLQFVIPIFVLLLLSAVGATVFVLRNQNNKPSDNTSLNTTEVLPTAVETSIPATSTPFPDLNTEKVVKSYQATDENGKTSNLIIEYSGTPNLVPIIKISKIDDSYPDPKDHSKDIFVAGEYGNTFMFGNNNYAYYDIGTVKSGTYNGFKTYIAVYNVNPDNAVAYPVFQNELPGGGINYSYFALLSDGKTNVMLRENDDSWTNDNMLSTTKALSTQEFYDQFTKTSFNDDYISGTTTVLSNVHDESLLTKVYESPKDNVNFYIIKNSKSPFYIKNSIGFYNAVGYIPTIINTGVIQLTDKSSLNVSAYSYRAGHCSLGVIQNIVDLNTNDIKRITNDNYEEYVYEYINSEKDKTIQDLYKEYTDGGEDIRKYNSITADDAKILTYDQFLKYHPVIYWKDKAGRYVQLISKDFQYVGGCGKPVINIYSDTPTNVNVKLNIDGFLTISDPLYNPATGWNVTSHKDGTLTDTSGKSYEYLFWEGQFRKDISRTDKGWSIEKSKVKEFLNSKLTELGFNDREKNEFIEYWLPKINEENNPYIFITFVDEKALDTVAPLDISPKPDSYKRYFMWYRGEDTQRNIKPLTFQSFERKGLTVFEWGGAKIF